MWEKLRQLLYGDPKSVLTAAPPLTNYPTREDAEYARDYGFGYGTGNEGYVQGDTARVIGQPEGKLPVQTFMPRSASGMSLPQATGTVNDESMSRNLDLNRPANAGIQQRMGTTLAQAALAANRMPIAALGFDPSQTSFDLSIKNPTVMGSYSPKQDAIYAAAPEGGDPSAVVHESVHRGIKKLKEDPALAPLFKMLPSDDEYIVRYLMAKQGGDPEKTGGEMDQKQRKSALGMFDSGLFSTSTLEKLNRAAEEAIAARRPRGPR
jgi:hypothetical protein